MSRFAKQLNIRNFLNMMESKTHIRIFREDDELPDDKYFVQIPTPDLPPEIKVDGDFVNVGPFDTSADATAAAGDDLTVVNDEGTPVVDGEPAGGEGAPPADDTPPPPMEAKARKKWMEGIRKSVLKDIKEAEDTVTDVETDIGDAEGTDDSGAGNLPTPGNPDDVANAAPVDGEPVGQELDIDAERGPSDDNDGSPGAAAPDEGGTLDSNGGDITESGRNNEVWKGSYVTVMKKGGGQVDSGIVDKRTNEGITIGKNTYSFKEFTIIREA